MGRKSKVSIPYPGQESVVYERASTNPYWERRRTHALARIPKAAFTFDDSQIESFIRSAAIQERVKEEEFLNKFYKPEGAVEANETLTDKFNILFQSRELYEDYNKRIGDILTQTDRKNETYGQAGGATHEYFTGLAPNLSSVYLGYFITHLRTRLSYNKPPLTYADFNAVIENAVMGASRQMARIMEQDANEYGWGKEW